VIVFTVQLVPGKDHENLLSDEILEETKAQIMTTEQATALGFEGFPDDPSLRLIVVTNRDEGWIAKALERSPEVVGYDRQDVDM
jgi:hypothetical protein